MIMNKMSQILSSEILKANKDIEPTRLIETTTKIDNHETSLTQATGP